MSSQQIQLDLRHAIWLSHKRRCVYCTEPLSFGEADIDHIIPKTLAHDDELHGILDRFGLPEDFDLFSCLNLLPAHRRCNRAKSSSVFNEQSARFYLQLAQTANPIIQQLLAGQKQRNTRHNLLAEVGEAVRAGLILPTELQESQPPDELLLTKPLIFADRPDERVTSISLEQVEGYLNRPVLMGGDPSFAANFGDNGGVRVTVRTCKEYRAAVAAGFYAMTTYDIKSEAFLKTTNAVLSAAASLRAPLVSYIRSPHKGVADLDLLPASVLPTVLSEDEELISGMKDFSLGDILGRGEIKILSCSSTEISLEWNWGLLLREVCRADFDGDGIEDILCECYCWATEGTLGFGWTSVLARTGGDNNFVLSRL